MPVSVQKIIEMVTDMDVGAKEFTGVGSTDPVISLINSYYGQFRILWSQTQDRQHSSRYSASRFLYGSEHCNSKPLLRILCEVA